MSVQPLPVRMRDRDGRVAGLFDVDTPATPTVVMSWGLGVDSSYILARWLTDPTSRDFDLADLVVLTAMVGNEFAQTARDAETAILPLLAAHSVRYIQVGRSRRNVTADGEGVVILDDSRSPTTLHIGGDYTLGNELLTAATVPQIGGARKCSIKSKANVLSPVINRITAGQPYRHVLGFEAGEISRSRKDTLYNTQARTGWYPMQDWGVGRAEAIAYLKEVTGVEFARSACTFCPFALATEKGRDATMDRYRREPGAAVEALVIEATSRAVNERQGLIGERPLSDLIAAAGMPEILAAAEDRLDAMDHVLLEVRRIVAAKAGQPGKAGMIWRSVTRLEVGARAEMAAALAAMPGREVTAASGTTRRVLRSREDTPAGQFPQLEHFYVVAPAVVETKSRPGFDDAWQAATNPPAALF